MCCAYILVLSVIYRLEIGDRYSTRKSERWEPVFDLHFSVSLSRHLFIPEIANFDDWNWQTNVMYRRTLSSMNVRFFSRRKRSRSRSPTPEREYSRRRVHSSPFETSSSLTQTQRHVMTTTATTTVAALRPHCRILYVSSILRHVFTLPNKNTTYQKSPF
jgi:hypothetical protein